MKRIVSFLFALSLLAVAAPAHAAAPVFVFEAVDSVDSASFGDPRFLLVEGLLEGATTPTTQEFRFPDAQALANCQKHALLAMSKPGRFLLVLQDVGNGNFRTTCKLKRR